MKKSIILSLIAVACGAMSPQAAAQSTESEKFAIKASAEIGLGNSISTSSTIGSSSTKATSGDYGVDFGWTFWKKQNHSLEANIGVAYSPTSVKSDLGSLDYNYEAPASADVDGDPYRRFYEISRMHQKVTSGRITIPVYLAYAYRCNEWLGVHADLGVRLGFKTSAKLSEVSGEAYSYGVYPQYDNLLINESYLNDFGTTNLAYAKYGEPACNVFSTSVLVGVGAEFRIYKYLAADLSFRYNRGITNIFKGQYTGQNITHESAPVNYIVENGQQVKSMTDYLSSSKLNRFSLCIGLIYRF